MNNGTHEPFKGWLTSYDTALGMYTVEFQDGEVWDENQVGCIACILVQKSLEVLGKYDTESL